MKDVELTCQIEDNDPVAEPGFYLADGPRGDPGAASVVKLSGNCIQCGHYSEYRVAELWCASCHNRLEDMGAI